MESWKIVVQQGMGIVMGVVPADFMELFWLK